MLTRVDFPQATRGAPQPEINCKTTSVQYSVEMIGALLGIDREILRVSYDPMRHAVCFYIYDPSLDESLERREGCEPAQQIYVPDEKFALTDQWEPVERMVD